MRTTRITYTNGLTGDKKESHEFLFATIYNETKEKQETHVFHAYRNNAGDIDFHWTQDGYVDDTVLQKIAELAIRDFANERIDDMNQRNNWIASFTEE